MQVIKRGKIYKARKTPEDEDDEEEEENEVMEDNEEEFQQRESRPHNPFLSSTIKACTENDS